MTFRQRILVSVLLLTIAFALFWCSPQSVTVTESLSESVTVTTTRSRGHQFFEWLALLSLAAFVWLWRSTLGLTGFGGVGWESSVTQMTDTDLEESLNRPEEPECDSVGAGHPTSFQDATQIAENERFSSARSFITTYLQEHHAINVSTAARELGVSNKEAASLLSSMFVDGTLRRDGYPRHTLFTLADSLENQAIDFVRDEILGRPYRVVSERRYLRIRQTPFDIDAVIECEERIFLVELKRVRGIRIDHAIKTGKNHLGAAAAAFPHTDLGGVLVFLVDGSTAFDTVTEQLKRITLDLEELPIRWAVFRRKHRTSQGENDHRDK